MRIMLIGANGQLGTDLCAALAQHSVLSVIQPGTERGVLSPVVELDISRAEDVRAAINEHKPDVVINTAAFHRVDDIERDASIALQVNALAAQQLALICREADLAMMFISTDYVFGGSKRTPYTEADVPDPISAYGATKLAGELLIRSAWHKHYIIRTCGLYGTAGAMGKGGNFVNTMLRLAKEGKQITVIHDQVCTPTFTQDLAAQIATLIQTNQYGTYHATSDGACSWYEFACEIFRLAGLAPHVTPITSEEFGAPAKRPAYSVLENLALQNLGIDQMRDWHAALAEYVALVHAPTH